MSKIPRRLFLILNTPVELARPVQLSLRLPTPKTEALFAQYVAYTEEQRKLGDLNPCMRKEDVYKWIRSPPCGPRVRIVEVFIDPDRLR